MDDLIIKKSKIGQFDDGLGVFANRDFKKGEVVVKYNLKILTRDQFRKLPKSEKNHIHIRGGVIYLYPLPARYVNHSSAPNTIQNFEEGCDIAVRDIKKNEEITCDSTKEDFD